MVYKIVKSEPAVEVALYKGIKFRRYPQSENWSDRMYFRPNGRLIQEGMEALHREIYKDYHGAIPDGYHVHHKDENSLNNSPENLEAITAKEHFELHGPPQWESREKMLEHLDRARLLAIEWHKTEAGIAWHKELGRRSWENREESNYVCEWCGKSYTSLKVGAVRFCSAVCRSAERRANGIDNEQRECEWCGEEFSINKYESSTTCSRSCGAYLREQRKAASL